MKTFNQIRYGEYSEAEQAVTLRNCSGDYGGGSEVLVLQRRFSDLIVRDTDVSPTLEAGGVRRWEQFADDSFIHLP